MARPAVKYDDNFEEIANELRRAGIKMQEAAAETLNVGVEFIEMKYRARLRQIFKIRSRYTMGAIMHYKAHARRSNGRDLRRMRNIDAKVGVRKLSGGDEHYLLAQEVGDTKAGYRATAGKVPVPLNAARTGGNPNRPIAKSNRINNANIVHRTDLRGLNPRQQYAALKDRARRGQINRNDLVQTEYGMFRVSNRKITLVRSTEKSHVRIRARYPFRDSVHLLTERMMIRTFQIAARRLLRQAGLPN